MSDSSMNRRGFLKRLGMGAGAGLAGGLVFHGRIAKATPVSPNDKINVGIIGVGGMGTMHLSALLENPNCNLVAICDVNQKRYEKAQQAAKDKTGANIPTYQDFRHVLDRPDVDAVFCPTPDHWHPLLAISGCQAGKDVYVEKPACPTVVEGRAMVDAARRYGRIVQLGTQQRSMPVFQKAIELVHNGTIGQVTSAGAWVGTNGAGVGETPMPAPAEINWDLWLGPAPYVEFSPERYYGFMGWHDFARGGELTNWGVHLMDIVQWGIQQDRPLSIQAIGGSFRDNAGQDNLETIEILYEYKGCNVSWIQRHSNGVDGHGGYGIRFSGTKGELYVSRSSYEVFPAELGIEKYIGEPEKTWANVDHHNNFFSCIRSRRRPAADIEQGVRSTTACLLGGIALKTRRKLTWDGEAERIVRDDDACRYLERAYRAPWHL